MRRQTVSALTLSFAAVSVIAACTTALAPVGETRSSITSTPLPGDVLTQRVDNGRTGATTYQGLNASTFGAASKWGLLKTLPVNGAVYAQPLYVQQVTMGDGSVRDLIIVATALNYVYAFDANTYESLWKSSATPLGTPDPDSPAFAPDCIVDPSSSFQCPETTAAPGTLVGDGKRGLGILSTPVVDRSLGQLYLTYRTQNGAASSASGGIQQHVAAISLASGAKGLDHVFTNAGIDASGNCATGTELCGDVRGVIQRASLLLSNGLVYVAFAGHNEFFDSWNANRQYEFRGQVLAIDPTTMTVKGSFMPVAPGPTNTRMGGGIWQASSGIAADPNGDVYFAVGNAMSFDTAQPPPLLPNGGLQEVDPDEVPPGETPVTNPHPADYMPQVGSYANAIVRLHPQTTNGVTTLSPVTTFTPYRAYWQNVEDFDLGSAGVLLPPNTNDVVQGGKEGILYVLNRDSMGGLPAHPLTQAEYLAWAPPPSTGAPTTCDPDDFCEKYAPGCTNGPLKGYLPNDPSQDVNATNQHPIQELVVGHNFDLDAPMMNCWVDWPHIHGTPTYATLSNGSSYLYVWTEKGPLKAFQAVSTNPLTFATTPAIGPSAAPLPDAMPGGFLSVSTDPTGGGALFANVPIDYHGPADANNNKDLRWTYGSLHAYNPVPDAQGHLDELWSDFDSAPYFFAKFVPPTIAKNHVVQPTFSNRVLIYGPGAAQPIAPLAPPSAGVTLASEGSSSLQTTALVIDQTGAVRVFWEGYGVAWESADSGQLTGPGAAPPGAPITTYSAGNVMHAFFVGASGGVHWLTRTVPSAWQDRGLITAAGYATPGGDIATVTQGSTMSAVVLGKADGAIHLLTLNLSGTTFSDQALPSGATFGPSTHLATASLATGAGVGFRGESDVLAIDASGQIQDFVSSYLVTTRAYSTWSAPRSVASGFAPGGHLTAASYFSKLGVFSVNQAGALVGFTKSAVDGAFAQTTLETTTPIDSVYAPPGGGLASASMAYVDPSGGLHDYFFVFTVANHGGIDAFRWDNVAGSWSGQLYSHTRSFGVATPGSPLAAVSTSAPSLDVVVAGKTGLFALGYAAFSNGPYAGQYYGGDGTDYIQAPIEWTPPLPITSSASNPAKLKPQTEAVGSAGLVTAGLQSWVTGDFDGDGHPDFVNVWAPANNTAVGFDAYLDRGAAFTWSPGWDKGTTGLFTEGLQNWVAGDFNHDGRPDIANVWSASAAGVIGIDVYANEGGTSFLWEPNWTKGSDTGTFSPQQKWIPGDYNHDGWTDLANVWSDSNGNIGLDVYENTQQGGFLWKPAWGVPGQQGTFTTTQSWFAGDFDGDGWVDLADVWQSATNQIGIDVHLNTHASTFTLSPNWGATGTQGTFDPTEQWAAGDFDGDGRIDLANAFSDDNSGFVSIDVHSNSGAKTFTQERWVTKGGPWSDGSLGFNTNQRWVPGDFNADGHLDLGYTYTTLSGVAGVGEYLQ